MRQQPFRMDTSRALALVARAPVVHLATTTPEGAPVLRTVHAVVLDDFVAFHGARTGEKAGCLGRPAVIGADEIHAVIPSWFVHPDDGSMAGTFYESAQIHGLLEPVEDPQAKSRILEALMRKYQAEGKYRPIDPVDPLYADEVRRTLVVRLVARRIEGRAKLGQNKQPQVLARIVERLLERGLPGDLRAVARVRDAKVPGLPETGSHGAGEAGSLDQVRAAVDRLDREIVSLIAKRGRWVEAAARFKKTDEEARAPARVEQVIARVRAIAVEQGASPVVVDAAYRAMIAAFIEIEQERIRTVAGFDG